MREREKTKNLKQEFENIFKSMKMKTPETL
jgi:hypothetical protein